MEVLIKNIGITIIYKNIGITILPLQLDAVIEQEVAHAKKDYDLEMEPECFVQAYMQKMPSNSLLTLAFTFFSLLSITLKAAQSMLTH